MTPGEIIQRFEAVDMLLEARMKENMELLSKLEKAEQKLAQLEQNTGGYTLCNDAWILNQCVTTDESGNPVMLPPDKSMITPFVGTHVSGVRTTVVSESGQPIQGVEKKISFGLSSFGYDVTLSRMFKVFTAVPVSGGPGLTLIDPKNFDTRCFVEMKGDHVILPPHSFMLGVTNEYLRMPNDVAAICYNKSTYARCGINVSTTVAEPGWCGQLVLEITNQTPLPAKIYAGEGIAQLMFHKGNSPIVDYARRNGKYQGQTGVQTAI